MLTILGVVIVLVAVLQLIELPRRAADFAVAMTRVARRLIPLLLFVFASLALSVLLTARGYDEIAWCLIAVCAGGGTFWLFCLYDIERRTAQTARGHSVEDALAGWRHERAGKASWEPARR